MTKKKTAAEKQAHKGKVRRPRKNPQQVKEEAKLAIRKGKKPCSSVGCFRVAFCRGLCNPCYVKMKCTGNCVSCDKKAVKLNKKKKCHRCAQEDIVGIVCVVCHKTRPLQKRTEDGPHCAPCYRKKDSGLRPTRECSKCGQVARTIKWDPKTQKSICSACYAPPIHSCFNCKLVAPCHRYLDLERKQPVCVSCYHILDLQPKHICSNCGQSKIQKGTDDSGKPLCGACCASLNNRAKECSNCHEHRNPNSYQDDLPLCNSCSRLFRAPAVCFKCKQSKPVHARIEGQSCCYQCYRPYPCPEMGCDHASHSKNAFEKHLRSHSVWKHRSKMEEKIFNHLESIGYKRVRPGLDPTKGPTPKTFWYNSRPFTTLTSDKKVNLEADFIIHTPTAQPLWLELNGIQHYYMNKRDNGDPSLLARRQEHDKKRAIFALTSPPFPMHFLEIPYFEFEPFFLRFKALFVR